ncbi:OLC1v1012839C1 [Oldenlandia corymbosa var. corymbosa]|uniref:OLC1v1012839C1 n=1 Tax=Oldenlandia corymbosa var. corymbosa TaxID=529605 RepID=A0AAV1DWX6_OLDCO|nr:OLC1v1012839C1 [Oldenlandia corymbosa var. corymbosa]
MEEIKIPAPIQEPHDAIPPYPVRHKKAKVDEGLNRVADKTIFIDRELNYIDFVDKVWRTAGFDKGKVKISFVLVWNDSSGRRGYMHIHDDEGIPLIYLVSQHWLELEDEHPNSYRARPSSWGFTEQAGSDDKHVPSGESSDEEDGNDTSAFVNPRWKAYEAYADISGWDNPLIENDTYAEKLWDGVIDHIKAGIYFLCKDDAQDAVAKWSTDRGRTFITVKSDGSRWCVKCATSSPKYPQERLSGIPCNWWVRVAKQDDTDLWKVVLWSDSHTCPGENNKKDSQNVTSTLIARLVTPSVRLEPTYIVKLVQENVFDVYHVNTVLTPHYMAKYNKWRLRGMRHKVTVFSQQRQLYEVVTGPHDNRPWKGCKTHEVQFGAGICTYLKWQTYRFPCSHTIIVAITLDRDPISLVDPCHTREGWIAQFSGDFALVHGRGPAIPWKLIPDDTRLVHHSGKGRKQMNRKKGVQGYSNRGSRREPTCSRC